MVIGKKTLKSKFTLEIGENRIGQADKFNYIGSIITNDGKCDGN